MKPVLVLSGHVISLAIVRALGPAGVPVFVASYDRRDIAPYSRLVRGAFDVPHPETATEACARRLLEFGHQHDHPVLMPGDDPSLIFASNCRESLGRAFIVACPDRETVAHMVDKRATYSLAAAAGVSVPMTMSPTSSREAADAADAVGYPCLLKPATSHRYFEQLGVKYRRVESRREAEEAFLEAERLGIGSMVQELIPGGDEAGVNYNAYVIDGEVRVEFTARKVRMVPPGGGVPGAVVSEEIVELLDPGRRTLGALNLTGYACCEFKWDSRLDTYRLLEVNGRHNRSGLLATRCGINFPLVEYEYLVNGRVPTPVPFRVRKYWVDEFKDLSCFPARVREHPGAVVSFWRPYVRRPVCAVLDWHDSRPFVRRLRYSLDVMRRLIRGGGTRMPKIVRVSRPPAEDPR